jgi:uncharacterized protein (TIRG00374 family)
MGVPVLLFFLGRDAKEKIREKVCAKVVQIVDNVASGFDLLKSPRKFTQCFFLSVVVWVLSAVAYYVVSLGCPGVQVSFLEMAASMVIICFFISLPSVPGFWGVWEAGGVFALLIFSVPVKEAAGFTLTNHVVQIVPIVLVGLFSSMVTGAGFLKLDYGKNG